MLVAKASKVTFLSQAKDPKAAMWEAIGDLSGIKLLYNQLLIGTYIRPERTAGGLIRPDTNVDEDQFQGKVGLVLRKGPQAFQDDGGQVFEGQNVSEGDWVVYKIFDGWALTLNGVPCRMVQDVHIKMIIKDPNILF